MWTYIINQFIHLTEIKMGFDWSGCAASWIYVDIKELQKFKEKYYRWLYILYNDKGWPLSLTAISARQLLYVVK